MQISLIEIYRKSDLKILWVNNDFWILLAMYFFSLPIGKTLWIPLLIMSISGVVFFARDLRSKHLVGNSQYLLIIAALFYIPALFSLPDSLDTGRTSKYLIVYPLYVAVGYFLLARLKQSFELSKILNSIATITVLWSLCAIWQLSFPSLSPFPEADSGRYQGVFGRSDMILGYTLAGIIPFLSFGYWQLGKQKWAIVLFILLAFTCFISGNRASWVSIMVMVGALPLMLFVAGYRLSTARLGTLVAGLVVVFAVVLLSIKGSSVEKRAHDTLEFFTNPSFETFDHSSAGRGEIFSTAIKIGVDNPFNGTGISTFRYAHPYYAPENTLWRQQNPDESSPHKYTGAMYPHQLLLQQFAGAGWPGLLGIIIFYALLAYLTFIAARSNNIVGMGASLAVWVGFFPLNTHLNFHGSWLTANFWVWIGLMLGLTNVLKAKKQE